MHSRYADRMEMSVMEARQSVAAEVRAVLARKRIPVSKAARLLGVGQSWLHRRVAGEIPFDVGEISALASILDTPVERFFTDVANVSSGGGIRKRSFLAWRRHLRFSAA